MFQFRVQFCIKPNSVHYHHSFNLLIFDIRCNLKLHFAVSDGGTLQVQV